MANHSFADSTILLVSLLQRGLVLFTALVETYELLCKRKLPLLPSDVVESLNKVYTEVKNGSLAQNSLAGIYYKAALQASNDRVNRVRRGIIFDGLILGSRRDVIMERLREQGLS